MPRVVVFAVGNESRGDDGVGPGLLRLLEPALPAGGRAVLDFQLQVEHALELGDADLALFVDASCGLEAPFAFYEIGPEAAASSFTHALSPSAVLAVFRRIEQLAPPPAFVLGIRASRFELGQGLSPGAAADLDCALEFARELMAVPDPVAWRVHVGDRPGIA
ncbi:hydrogenase maturation protease [Aromatoleum diolicum]|nr:hydrogenase maturation protease [Aromatoleum diolicum]